MFNGGKHRFIALILPALFFLGAQGLRAAAPEKTATPPKAPAEDLSKYVGADTCKTCHEDVYKGFEKTPHWKTTFLGQGPAWHGC